MIIHLIRPARGTNARRIFIRRSATIPEDFIGPAALPLFCLAPHGVFRASRIAPSGELLPRLFTLTCAFLKEPAVSFL